MMNPQIDQYLIDGCGRCKYYQTPACKVHTWYDVLVVLREIVLASGLKEELKWSMPTYTFEGKNILMVTAFKEFASISFFKGALLKDEKKLLVKQGENVQSARIIKFTDAKDVVKLAKVIRAYILESIEIEKKGLHVETVQNPEPIPQELQARLDDDAVFKKAFFSLTPGKQRAYIIYISQPKQSKTRESRIDQCLPKILNGEGFHDSYKNKGKSV